MKICHVTWGLTYGGIETMLVNIANEQARLGHEVHVVVVNDLGSDLLDNFLPEVRIHHIGRKVGSHNPWHIVKLNTRLAKIGADVIHLHAVNIFKFIYKPCVGAKICATHHTTYLPSDDKWLRRVPVLFTISEAAAESIDSTVGRRATVVENGIVTKGFRQKTDYNSHGRTFRLVQVGRLLAEVKGQDILLRALQVLVGEKFDISVDFYGDGPDMQELKELAATLGIAHACRFMGEVPTDKVSQSLADYDLLVQPSRREGFGLTLVEAMSAGLPVLAADLPAMQSILDDGRVGLLFKAGDVEDCARALRGAVDRDMSAMAKAAREMACARYDVAQTAARYIAQYEKII